MKVFLKWLIVASAIAIILPVTYLLYAPLEEDVSRVWSPSKYAYMFTVLCAVVVYVLHTKWLRTKSIGTTIKPKIHTIILGAVLLANGLASFINAPKLRFVDPLFYVCALIDFAFPFVNDLLLFLYTNVYRFQNAIDFTAFYGHLAVGQILLFFIALLFCVDVTVEGVL